MPILPENRRLYPSDWPAISREVRQQAGNKCQRCRAPNGQPIARGSGPDAGTYMLMRGQVFDDTTGEYYGRARGSEYSANRMVKVVLTVAHLDHDPRNNGEPGNRPNLRALCQQCHNRHDAKDRAKTRRNCRAVSDLFDACAPVAAE